jgi:hypothetical protein
VPRLPTRAGAVPARAALRGQEHRNGPKQPRPPLTHRVISKGDPEVALCSPHAQCGTHHPHAWGLPRLGGRRPRGPAEKAAKSGSPGFEPATSGFAKTRSSIHRGTGAFRGRRGRGRPHPFQGGPQARDEVRCYSAELGRAQLGRALLDKPSPKKTAAKTKNTTPIPESSWVKS